jgi:tRNA threonylcarbamoyladenosine biosynthesis protein TsaE
VNREPPSPATAAVAASHSLLWNSEADTQAFAALLAGALQTVDGDALIALHGDLGAGKTTLVRHLLRALGVTGRVKSPTYAVVESYALPAFAVWHLDFYRFHDPQEFEDAGLRDIFASPGLKLVEWPDKAAGHLPAADLDLYLGSAGDTCRTVELRGHSVRGAQLWSVCADP